ncbi:MAG: ribonuclease P protein component [Rhodospirillaceae bacterium]|nr:ribonuclease P protein component [Rhodospirillaceae bacterium]
MTVALMRIKHRPEFLRVASSGKKWAAPGLVLQIRQNKKINSSVADGILRIGFTVSRKVGNAVARNRAKRRLRALTNEIMPVFAKPGFDYVLIGRHSTIKRPFEMLKQDLKNALSKTGTAMAASAKATPAKDGAK